MSGPSEKLTPSASGERVPSGSSNNHLLPPTEGVTTRPHPEEKTTLPQHRHKCIRCGCPRFCCTQAGFLLWVLILILIQGGPIAVLYMDHHYSNKYGTTLSRYQIEQGMKPAMCRTVGIYSVNITGKCKDALANQPCVRVRVIVFENQQTNAVINSTYLLRSEREYVLPGGGLSVSTVAYM